MVVRIDRLVLSMELYYGSGMSKCKLLDDVLLLHINHESKVLYCVEKDAFVADQIHWKNGDMHWDILFTRLVNDWELENLQYFHALLYSRYIEWRGDRMAWRPIRKGSFEVKSHYRVLSDGGI